MTGLSRGYNSGNSKPERRDEHFSGLGANDTATVA